MRREWRSDLTTGNVFGTLLSFSIPYFFSYFLQTLYGMADLYIVGQFDAVESTTAVSIGSQIMHMITVMIVGLAMGTTVSIGHEAGAKNEKRMFAAIGNTVVLFLSLSVLSAVILTLCIRPIVSVMSTPAEAVESTVAYLTICFIGIPFITAYNIISSIFRGMGDSRSPMYFIAVACVSNIALDYLFIGALGMGAAGAALGTTLAQTISVAAALLRIRTDKGMRHIRLSAEDFKPQRTVMGKLLAIGVPVAVQDGFIQISFLLITVIANRRGAFRRGGSGCGGEDHRHSVFGAFLAALLRVGAGGAEYRGRKEGAGEADVEVCDDRGGGFWYGFGASDAVFCRAGGRHLPGRAGGRAAGRAVSEGLCMGLCVRGRAFLFQRVFLRQRNVGAFLFA